MVGRDGSSTPRGSARLRWPRQGGSTALLAVAVPKGESLAAARACGAAPGLGVRAPVTGLGVRAHASGLGVRAPATGLGVRASASGLGVRAPATGLGVRASGLPAATASFAAGRGKHR